MRSITQSAAQRLRMQMLLLGCAALLQLIVPLTRILTTYRAIEMDIPVWMVSVIPSAFALLPVFFTVLIGRHNDRHGEGGALVLGCSLVMVAVLCLWQFSATFAAMLAFTSLLGIGQVMMVSALQMVTTRCSDANGQDRVVGNFLVANSLGQVLGPLAISLTTPAGATHPGEELQFLLAGAVCGLLAMAVALWFSLPRHARVGDGEDQQFSSMLATPGLMLIVGASALCVTVSDLVLAFFPIIGALRGIDAATVGLLLSARAVSAMTSRLFFSRLALALGRTRLLVVSLVGCALALALMAAPVPVWALALAISISGFSIGTASASSMSMTLTIAPAPQRATAMSLRLAAARLGQFAIPIGAGGIIAFVGTGGIFIVMSAVALGTASLIGLRVANT